MQTLYEDDSVARHVDAALKHEQLCRQNGKSENYISLMVPVREALEKAYADLKAAIQERTTANDMVWQCDTKLDNVLRKLHNRASEYDRSNPGKNVRELFFPDGKLYPVISMPFREEPDTAGQIANMLEKLGTDHPLHFLVEEIRGAIAKSKAAISDYEKTLNKVAYAQTAVYVAKGNLRRRFEANYYIAALEFGKDFAEKLFPKIHKRRRSAGKENPEDEEDVA